jgi:hypothetical protein
MLGMAGVVGVEMFGERVHVRVDPQVNVTPATFAAGLEAGGLAVDSIRPIATSLEDVFIARLAGRASASVRTGDRAPAPVRG